MKQFIWLSIYLLLVSACSDNKKEQKTDSKVIKPEATDNDKALLEKAKGLFQPLPALADKDISNVISDERVKLGKILFYDTRLSKTGKNSCNSCHNLATFGVDNQATSDGDNGGRGTRNSPTVLNAALHIAQFWDGRAKDVEEQAGKPILNPMEMAIPSETFLINRLKEIELYKKLFKSAFLNEKNPITYLTLRKSIAAFERTLITPSRFDEYLNGNIFALSDTERDGLNTFIETGCTQCHSGATVGGGSFQKFGVFADYRTLVKITKEDEGKKNVSKLDADKDIFKVPGLRNIDKTAPYFHNGSVSTLSEAVKIMAKLQVNKDLSEEQIKSIVVFLKTLTGAVPENAKIIPAELNAK
jgi:cytochrome c peroxidase